MTFGIHRQQVSSGIVDAQTKSVESARTGQVNGRNVNVSTTSNGGAIGKIKQFVKGVINQLSGKTNTPQKLIGAQRLPPGGTGVVAKANVKAQSHFDKIPPVSSEEREIIAQKLAQSSATAKLRPLPTPPRPPAAAAYGALPKFGVPSAETAEYASITNLQPKSPKSEEYASMTNLQPKSPKSEEYASMSNLQPKSPKSEEYASMTNLQPKSPKSEEYASMTNLQPKSPNSEEYAKFSSADYKAPPPYAPHDDNQIIAQQRHNPAPLNQQAQIQPKTTGFQVPVRPQINEPSGAMPTIRPKLSEQVIIAGFGELKKESQHLHITSANGPPRSKALSITGQNRWTDVMPRDETLLTRNKDYYYNASEIHLDGSKYIQAQGPVSMYDAVCFWRSVIDSNTSTIACMTPEYEGATAKCFAYWDAGKLNEINKDLAPLGARITLGSETPVPDVPGLKIREFHVSQNGQTRIVKQMHYEEWKDKGVTDNFEKLVAKANELHKGSGGELICQCSAGVGRSGTLLMGIHASNHPDKFKGDDFLQQLDKTILAARNARGSDQVVQTADQYSIIANFVNNLR